MVIINGNLMSIDVTIDAEFNVGEVSFGVRNLWFTFQNTSQILGGVDYIPGSFNEYYDTVKSYSTAERDTIFTLAGTAFIDMDKLMLEVTFGDESTTPG